MATKTHHMLDVEAAVNQWSQAAREAGNDYLEAYGKTVDQLADFGVQAAAATKLPGVIEIAQSQAKLSRDFAERYISVNRELLEA